MYVPEINECVCLWYNKVYRSYVSSLNPADVPNAITSFVCVCFVMSRFM